MFMYFPVKSWECPFPCKKPSPVRAPTPQKHRWNMLEPSKLAGTAGPHLWFPVPICSKNLFPKSTCWVGCSHRVCFWTHEYYPNQNHWWHMGPINFFWREFPVWILKIHVHDVVNQLINHPRFHPQFLIGVTNDPKKSGWQVYRSIPMMHQLPVSHPLLFPIPP